MKKNIEKSWIKTMIMGTIPTTECNKSMQILRRINTSQLSQDQSWTLKLSLTHTLLVQIYK